MKKARKNNVVRISFKYLYKIFYDYLNTLEILIIVINLKYINLIYFI